MAARLFWENLIGKWFRPPLPATARDLTGRTVIVTGSNSGIGFETVKHFYNMNPSRLIMAVRDMEKGETAKKAILLSKRNSNETKIEVWKLDLASFESTKAFANKANAELDRLDILLANAGVFSGKWNTTVDGWEVGIQTNVLSTFLLSALLLPLLRTTATLSAPLSGVHLKPHLVIVASDVHFMAKFPQRSASHIFSTLNNKDLFLGGDRYYTTKLLDVFLTREFAKSVELKNGNIVMCCVNPGFCRSELAKERPAIVRAITYALLARTAEEGSRNFLWTSLTDNIPLGSYTSSCRVEQPSSFVESSQGAKVQMQLWKELQEILIKVAPETENVWNTV